MSDSNSNKRQSHWDGVYQTKLSTTVSWYCPHLKTSVELLLLAGLNSDSNVIDVGAGASTLVDDLLSKNLKNITVLDISGESLALSKKRLGDRSALVNWIIGDVTTLTLPKNTYTHWHDRAVLHFLATEWETRLYVDQVNRSLKPSGYVVIGGFSPTGPEQCSGLTVARRSAQDIVNLFGPRYQLVTNISEEHETPGGNKQDFAYVLLKKQH